VDNLTKTVSRVTSLADKLAWLAVAGMMVLVVFNCISRRLGLPIYGTYDYVGFLLVLVIVPALAQCAFEKGHIYLSMLTDKFPQKTQKIVDIVIYSVCSCFFLVVVWALVDRAIRAIETGLTGMTSPIPIYPFIFIEAIAVALLCSVYLVNIVQTVGELRRVS